MGGMLNDDDPMAAGPEDGGRLPRRERRTRDAAIFDEQFGAGLPSWMTGRMGEKQKARYVRKVGKDAFRSGRLGEISDDLYNAEYENQLGDWTKGELERMRGGEELVDTRRGDAPTLAATGDLIRQRLSGAGGTTADTPMLAHLSRYARERLDTPLTAAEMAAFRGSGIEAVDRGAAEGKRTLANSLSRAGLGRSGLAFSEAGKLERERERGRSGVERDLIAKQLEQRAIAEQLAANVSGQEATRRAHLEGLGAQIGGQEDQARRFDVAAEEERRARIEQLLGSLATLGEARREYDVGLIEGRKQSKLSRRLYERALRNAQPSGWEKAAGYVGGVIGGLGA
jgi:hypothetical protein